MGKGGGGRGVRQVVRRDIDRLHRGDGPVLGGGDALLKGAHLVGQRGLVAHGGGHPPHQGRDLGTSLDIAEDVVDEEQHILLLPVPEVLRHGQPGQGHAHAGSGGLVHLSKDQRGLFNDPRLAHLPPRSLPSRVRSPTPVKMEYPPCSVAMLWTDSWMSTVLPTPAPPNRPILPPLA